MDFNSLVLSLLNESPDNTTYEGKTYTYDNKNGNQITFIIDPLRVVLDPYGEADEKTGDPIMYDPEIGECIVYTPTIPKHDAVDYMTHPELEYLLSELEFNYKYLKNKLNVRVFNPNPNISVDKFFKKLSKKHPDTVFCFAHDEPPKTKQGRLWKESNKVLVSMWLFNKKIIQTYVVPFVKFLYPEVKDEDIMIERSEKEWIAAAQLKGHKTAAQPYEPIIADLLKQLHTSSGDKEAIKNKIKEVCAKYNLDPKKYGISDDVLKGSQLTANKLLGTSKDTMAGLKARQQTSESRE